MESASPQLARVPPTAGNVVSRTSGKPDRVAETMAAVASRIVAELDRDPEQWSKPWASAACGSPTNPTTGREYSGINWWYLLGVGLVHGYDSGHWAGFRQWQSVGASVRKGEKASYAVRFVVRACCEESDCDGECGNRRRVTARSLAVFAREQVEVIDADLFAAKIPELVPREPADFDAEQVTKLLAKSGAVVSFSGSRAYYDPRADRIACPVPADFDSLQGFGSTLAHEHIHWTGHKSRLARDLSGSFGSASYAREELVAELGAVMFLASEGLEHSADKQHAAYIRGWLGALEESERPKAVAAAIGQATRAAEHLRTLTT